MRRSGDGDVDCPFGSRRTGDGHALAVGSHVIGEPRTFDAGHGERSYGIRGKDYRRDGSACDDGLGRNVHGHYRSDRSRCRSGALLELEAERVDRHAGSDVADEGEVFGTCRQVDGPSSCSVGAGDVHVLDGGTTVFADVSVGNDTGRYLSVCLGIVISHLEGETLER